MIQIKLSRLERAQLCKTTCEFYQGPLDFGYVDSGFCVLCYIKEIINPEEAAWPELEA